jgi:hypothetical protein
MFVVNAVDRTCSEIAAAYDVVNVLLVDKAEASSGQRGGVWGAGDRAATLIAAQVVLSSPHVVTTPQHGREATVRQSEDVPAPPPRPLLLPASSETTVAKDAPSVVATDRKGLSVVDSAIVCSEISPLVELVSAAEVRREEM